MKIKVFAVLALALAAVLFTGGCKENPEVTPVVEPVEETPIVEPSPKITGAWVSNSVVPLDSGDKVTIQEMIEIQNTGSTEGVIKVECNDAIVDFPERAISTNVSGSYQEIRNITFIEGMFQNTTPGTYRQTNIYNRLLVDGKIIQTTPVVVYIFFEKETETARITMMGTVAYDCYIDEGYTMDRNW
jgi:hypothetical protein